MTRATAVLMLIGICGAMWPGGSARAQEPAMERLTLSVEATTTGTATVELTNNSNKPIRVFRDSNTWGAARWRLLKVKDGRTEAFAQTAKNTYFTRNVPAFDEIPAGGRLAVRLNVNDGNWLTSARAPARFESGDIVVAIYDVPPTPESEKFGVWHGIASGLTTVR